MSRIAHTLLALLLLASPMVADGQAVQFSHNGGFYADTFSLSMQLMYAPDTLPLTDVPYYQVWADRHGFVPRLSILDLLMNEGREGIFTLLRMAITDNRYSI